MTPETRNENENKAKETTSQSSKKKQQAKFEWPGNLVEAVISAWQDEPVLYDVSHPEYHLKDKRRIAVQRVSNKIEEEGFSPLPSLEEITRKLTSLRGYFVTERNKTNQSKVSGAGLNQVYKSKCQYFDSLQFLADKITARRTGSNLSRRKQGSNDGDDSKDYAYPVNNTPSAKSAKKIEAAKTNELLETAISVLKRPRQTPEHKDRTADRLFGGMVSKMLEEIPDGYAKDMAKIEIQKMLLQLKRSGHQQPQQQQISRQQMMYEPSRFEPFQRIVRTNSDTLSPTIDLERQSSGRRFYERGELEDL